MGDENHYYLFGDITDESVRLPMQWILSKSLLKKQDRPDFLSLIINSTGGSLSAAMALIDTMKRSRIPIQTIGVGNVMSAATMIFIHGKIGMRILTTDVEFMTHQVIQKLSGWASTSEIEAILDEAYEDENLMTALYISRSRKTLTSAFVRKNMIADEDKYFMAMEVKNKLGLAETVHRDYMKYM